MDEIVYFEYSTGAQAIDPNIYQYKVDGKKILKIDYPDSNGFIAIHKKNDETEYVKASFMKFKTRKQ